MQFQLLMLVLFLMGAQSAYFGPIKFGILPEMLREKDLPRANGIILMLTFMAIIFGTVAAGVLLAQNWPNPFNPSTTIAYEAPRGGEMDIRIYDLSGRLVRTLLKDYSKSLRWRRRWEFALNW